MNVVTAPIVFRAHYLNVHIKCISQSIGDEINAALIIELCGKKVVYFCNYLVLIAAHQEWHISIRVG